MTSRDTSIQVELERGAMAAEPDRITDRLIEFQQQRISGAVYVDAVLEESISKSVFLFQDGWIIYAGMAIPEPGEFLAEISRYLPVTVLREALGFAAKRASVRRVVRALVKVGVVGWPEIAEAIRMQALTLLTELEDTVGQVRLEAGPTTFDLHHESQAPKLSVEALLAELARQRLESDARPVVLSVDDSPIARATIERHLGGDYQVVSCGTAADAIAALYRVDAIECLLLDLTLPDMDGLDLCGVIRKRFENLPIIMVTSRDGIADRLRGRMAGANRYITKPFLAAELLAAIA